jgi:hypothetical protein
MANAAENCGAGRDRDEFSAEGYWTPERRARARPVPTPKVPMPEAWGGEQPATTGEAPPKGPPGHIPGQPPPGYGEEMSLAPQLAPGGDEEDEDYGPHGALEMPHPLDYPWSAVGKLFYTQNGVDDEGSAALIRPNLLLTAGHCVYNKDKGGKSRNVEFWPGYGYRKTIDHKTKKQIDDPAYCFKSSYLAWKKAWEEGERDEKYAYDYGLVWLDRDPGELIGRYLDYAWDLPTKKHRTWTAVGYPAPNKLAGGTIMYFVTGAYVPSYLKPGVFGLANDYMGHGSSGGPWITQGRTGDYTVNGVQSFTFGPAPRPMMPIRNNFSPVFTQEVDDLVKWISNPATRLRDH